MNKEYWICVVGPLDAGVFGALGEAPLRRAVENAARERGLPHVDILSGLGLDERGAKEAGDAHSRAIARALGEDVGVDPRDFIDGFRKLIDDYIGTRREAGDSIVGLPDLSAAIDRVEKEGIGPCTTERRYDPIDWSRLSFLRSYFRGRR